MPPAPQSPQNPESPFQTHLDPSARGITIAEPKVALVHWAVLPQVGHDPRTPANGKSQDNNVRGTQAGASKDYQDALHSSVKVRRLQDRIGRRWPPAITSSSPRESHEGKRREKKGRHGHWDKRRDLIKADDRCPQSHGAGLPDPKPVARWSGGQSEGRHTGKK